MGFEIAKSPSSQTVPKAGQTVVDVTPTANAVEGASWEPQGLSAQERDNRIAEVAYRLAEQRHFAPGFELDDWLTAEQEVDAPSMNLHGAIHE